MSKNFFFMSESVSEGHPDKVADQISDAILDEHLKQDKHARVACETLIAKNLLVIAGEITSNGVVNPEATAKKVLKNIGYNTEEDGFDTFNCQIVKSISRQANDIALGVDENDSKEQGAGDQGIMFGYACNETSSLLPLPLFYAHRLVEKQAELRKLGADLLKPDAKSQVTVHYRNNRPEKITSVVLSTQHKEVNSIKTVRDFVEHEIIRKVIPEDLIARDCKIYINPTGSFLQGGPLADTGLTGRKIIVDTYGGSAPHGGGAFSGKDPSKVDRSAAYAARYIAKNIVAAQIAERCTIQLSYAIGVAEPVSLKLDFHNTGKINESKVEEFIKSEKLFCLTPKGIINSLDLLRPIYLKTAAYGHFGRNDADFTWENTDKAPQLAEILKRNKISVFTNAFELFV